MSWMSLDELDESGLPDLASFDSISGHWPSLNRTTLFRA